MYFIEWSTDANLQVFHCLGFFRGDISTSASRWQAQQALLRVHPMTILFNLLDQHEIIKKRTLVWSRVVAAAIVGFGLCHSTWISMWSHVTCISQTAVSLLFASTFHPGSGRTRAKMKLNLGRRFNKQQSTVVKYVTSCSEGKIKAPSNHFISKSHRTSLYSVEKQISKNSSSNANTLACRLLISQSSVCWLDAWISITISARAGSWTPRQYFPTAYCCDTPDA